MSDIKNHWSGYITALGKNKSPTSTNTIPFENTSTTIGVSGFLDLKPANTKFQAQYDAMSGSWEGVSASDKATLKQKSDKTEFMPYSAR
uniref:Uncharacterized protein n=1 Tax=viral metagenome TaxID=1070528 RepID=A0A6C0EPE3_9ZZZZ